MAGIDYRALRNEITMDQVLKQLDFVPVTQSASQLRGPCPVHASSSGQSRTFSVNVHRGRYYCHKCHSHGNQLELWAAIHQLPLYEAAIDLCRAVGHDVPWIKRWSSKEQKRRGTGT